MGARQANDPNAMPLDAFITETMKILKKSPHATEICVERVKPLRFAEKAATTTLSLNASTTAWQQPLIRRTR
jgi:uncharacterized oxidoreductase